MSVCADLTELRLRGSRVTCVVCQSGDRSGEQDGGRGGGFVSVQSAVLNNVYIYSFIPPPPMMQS